MGEKDKDKEKEKRGESERWKREVERERGRKRKRWRKSVGTNIFVLKNIVHYMYVYNMFRENESGDNGVKST